MASAESVLELVVGTPFLLTALAVFAALIFWWGQQQPFASRPAAFSLHNADGVERIIAYKCRMQLIKLCFNRRQHEISYNADNYLCWKQAEKGWTAHCE